MSDTDKDRRVEDVEKGFARRGSRVFDIIPDPVKVVEGEVFIVKTGAAIKLYAKVDGALKQVTMT